MDGIAWIEQVLRPALADLQEREWTGESFKEFHRSWNRRIHEALIAGDLTIDQIQAAHDLLDSSMPWVLGVNFARRSFKASGTAAPGAVARRIDPDEI